MANCKHCSQEVPSYAKFCPKCGMADPVDNPTTLPENPPAAAHAPAPAPKAEKKPLDFGWFNKSFMVLFVIFGACAFTFMQLCGVYTPLVSFGFGITLGVFALLFALAFLAWGIIRFMLSLGESIEQRKLTRTRDIICLAISIIGFLFVLLMCIAIFILGDGMNDLAGMLG
ncbi:MAG: zinc ribbon domain-containing protein [Clostridiales bacterium]|nr:zinc ribbon domain-containing protein [Clostridiales bacterium]